MSHSSPVQVRIETIHVPTYLPAAPDKNPMFLEKRVYQGSSGKVYPLPFTDRIAETKTDHPWKAIWLENEYLRVMVLPEIGGRIHVAQDKTNDYDFIYRQRVIKPALVGLAGPWISGGIEFNWPQHHRPGTFLPVDYEIEDHADGSKTVWLGDHDRMTRMKGMHGVCLRPGRAYLELKVRAYNRTSLVQTFLWWANAAVHAHEAYQSFFPPDAHFVADHAKRAMSRFPLCQGSYYGVNYGQRARAGVPKEEAPPQFIPPHCLPPPKDHSPLPVDYPPHDLSWYANIPTPCSYMAMGSKEDFFGGYDHFKQAGFVHIADHHIAPGKKQWTWGNHPFGYAWDRNLTDEDGPYLELMAGVYTDNQPDFSFLHPGETKAWSQFWYPIQKIGPAHRANLEAAVSLSLQKGNLARLGISVTSRIPKAEVSLRITRNSDPGKVLARFIRDLAPGQPLVETVKLPAECPATALNLRVADAAGREIIAYSPQPPVQGPEPSPAAEPPEPQAIASLDELYLTGLHLQQYRHAIRCPTVYWTEGLRRDPWDARCNNALGLWHLHRGELMDAAAHFNRAIRRLTRLNPNPADGEPFYHLGLSLRYLLDHVPASSVHHPLFEKAYGAFYKAAWNQAWVAPAFHALAEMDCCRQNWAAALDHLDRSLRFNPDNLRAGNLKVMILGKLGREVEADALLDQILALDRLDSWACHLAGQPVTEDGQARLDIALDMARAGLYREAIAFLETVQTPMPPERSRGVQPVTFYTLGWLHEKAGDAKAALALYRQAEQQSPDYCFPSRLEETAIFGAALRANPEDARALYYLGNWLYDRRRHAEAIRHWKQSAKNDPNYSVVWRNLGMGYFNALKQPAKARNAYQRAFRANPHDARLLYERDQLAKRLGTPPRGRLKELEKYPDLVRQRDDLSIEICALYNQTGQPQKALEILSTRRFQPWEGGEGEALRQHARTHLALAQRALAQDDLAPARYHLETGLTSPLNLGEARHLLANQSNLHYWLGVACHRLGDKAAARHHWRQAATFRGDFQKMAVRTFSEMTYYSALAWQQLGNKAKARTLLRALLEYARKLQKAPAKIDYFATSLPAMLLFDDDLQFEQETRARFLQAQAQAGLGEKARARRLLREILERDPNHALAVDFMNEL